MNDPVNFLDPSGLEPCQSDPCSGGGGSSDGGDTAYYVDGVEVDAALASTIVNLEGGLSLFFDLGSTNSPLVGNGLGLYTMQVNPSEIEVDLDPFGFIIPSSSSTVALVGPGPAPNNPQQPQKPKCDPLTRLGGAIKALSAAGDAAGSFNLAWVHVAAAGFLIGAGCLEPTPFEPATCVASGFGGVALLGGATVLTNLGTHQVEDEVIPGIKQAVTCTPEGE